MVDAGDAFLLVLAAGILLLVVVQTALRIDIHRHFLFLIRAGVFIPRIRAGRSSVTQLRVLTHASPERRGRIEGIRGVPRTAPCR